MTLFPLDTSPVGSHSIHTMLLLLLLLHHVPLHVCLRASVSRVRLDPTTVAVGP